MGGCPDIARRGRLFQWRCGASRRCPAATRPAPAVANQQIDAEQAAERAYDLLCTLGLAEDVAEETLQAAPLAGRALCFIGSSGAGKTTSLLKTAVRLRNAGADVGIVGADLSHVGAREQLERYGQLLHLPVAFAYTPAEVAQEIAAAPPSRVLLVDTPACGLGPRASTPLDMFAPDLAALLGAIPRRVPVLVVPAGASEGDLERLALLARACGAAAAAITKLDEASDITSEDVGTLPGAGLALNVLARLRLPPLLCGTGRDALAGHVAPAAMELAVAALEVAAAGCCTLQTVALD